MLGRAASNAEMLCTGVAAQPNIDEEHLQAHPIAAAASKSDFSLKFSACNAANLAHHPKVTALTIRLWRFVADAVHAIAVARVAVLLNNV